MDYEKAYKNLMAKVKNAYLFAQTDSTKKVLEDILPELRESEDERIRKFLLDYAIEMIAGLESDISLSTYNGIKGHDPDAEEELSKWKKARIWLEKQKEQKPVGEIKDQRQIHSMIEDARRCGVIEGRKQVLDNPGKYGLQELED